MGGNTSSKKDTSHLSEVVRAKVLAIFREVDVDGSKTIDKEETERWWATNFAKINTMAMFEAVDIDNDGAITEDEWVEFWADVSKAGHNDEEILEELESLHGHGSWVKFDAVPYDRRGNN